MPLRCEDCGEDLVDEDDTVALSQVISCNCGTTYVISFADSGEPEAVRVEDYVDGKA